MAAFGRELFLTPTEFADLISDVAFRLGLRVVVDRGHGPEAWGGDRSSLQSSWEVYLGRRGLRGAPPADISAPKLGLVRWLAPKVDGSSLMLSSLDAKSDWYDEATNAVKENSDVGPLFQNIWKAVKRHFPMRIQVRDVRTGHVAAVKSCYATKAAAAWIEGGGQLRQPGVANQVFEIAATKAS